MNRRRILIGALILISVCIVVIIFASLFGEETPTAPEPTAAVSEGEAEPTTAPTKPPELEETSPPTEPPPPTNTPEPTEIPVTDTPEPTFTPEIEGLVKEGVHIVGTDIDPGIYVGMAGQGIMESCYWARLSDLTGSDNILANDNAVGLYYLEVLPEDRALDTNCDLLPIDQVPARDEFLTELPPGIYLIGRDIEAGTFKGEAGDDILDSCYWARLSNVSGENNILANDNATGQFYIEVLPTDFALQIRCEIEKVE
jgi:hypothetical protein